MKPLSTTFVGLLLSLLLSTACISMRRPPSHPPGEAPTTGICSGQWCAVEAAAGVAEAYAKNRDEEMNTLKNPTRITLTCHYAEVDASGHASSLRLPCNNVVVQVFDPGSGLLKSSLKARGEQIVIPVTDLPQTVRLVATMQGCARPLELPSVQKGSKHILFFELPCH